MKQSGFKSWQKTVFTVMFVGKTFYSHSASLYPGQLIRGVEILLVTSCYRNWDMLQPQGPIGSYAE